MKINSITAITAEFPDKLRHIPTPPQELFYRGELPDPALKSVAIVGTRKPTRYGTEVTLDLSRKLAERGVVIISGLALGVDALAHQGALKGQGMTVAVLAGGVDDPSPRTNALLAEEILKSGGGIVSEYPAGVIPYKDQFLARNRLVAGLADAVIVTEASLRSGTANTVMHALEQGREVYAVPGPITSPMSAGCNHMIAQGATPITSVDEFVEQFMPRAGVQQEIFAYTDQEKIIIDLLTSGVRDGDELHAKSQLDAGSYGQTITMLELRGAIKPLGANQWGL
ncbi:DNA-protecting protein DprA [Candidatus Saccharibacteria bacterium]|nr:MAG: DNA-protecting protein DprA [Candidatus Saccharibacteria bacterium]